MRQSVHESAWNANGSRRLSSSGGDHARHHETGKKLPFKQRVAGSSPARPTHHNLAEIRRYDSSYGGKPRRRLYQRCMKSHHLVTALVAGCTSGTRSVTTFNRTVVQASSSRLSIAALSPCGSHFPYVSTVIVIEACPSWSCT